MALQYHLYVPEVVREPQMHFYRVPRLGAFLAVPLEYNSCLFEKALDQSITDYKDYQKQIEELEKAKKEFDEDQEKIKEEKEKSGEFYVPEERQWPEVEEKPFLTKNRKYIVCLDTLGQDRQFTDEQKRFALETVKNFAAIWQRREQENLTKDRNLRLQMADQDKDYNENQLAKFTQEEEDHVGDHINLIMNPSVSQE